MLMRDPDRIEPFLNEVGKMWKEKVPDWRFGQLIYNMFSECPDPFFLEEDRFLLKLKDFLVMDSLDNL